MLSCGSWVAAMKAENPWLEAVCSVGPESETGLQGIDGRKVWLSIDKDVLDRAYARTDWSQGTMTLGGLKEQLADVFDRAGEILGVDICGELSTAKGATPEDRRINLQTNIDLQQFISNHIN